MRRRLATSWPCSPVSSNCPVKGQGRWVEWLHAMRREVGIGATLGDIGLANIDVDRVAIMAAADPCAGGNPVSLDADKLALILRAAIAGRF